MLMAAALLVQCGCAQTLTCGGVESIVVTTTGAQVSIPAGGGCALAVSCFGGAIGTMHIGGVFGSGSTVVVQQCPIGTLLVIEGTSFGSGATLRLKGVTLTNALAFNATMTSNAKFEATDTALAGLRFEQRVDTAVVQLSRGRIANEGSAAAVAALWFVAVSKLTLEVTGTALHAVNSQTAGDVGAVFVSTGSGLNMTLVDVTAYVTGRGGTYGVGIGIAAGSNLVSIQRSSIAVACNATTTTPSASDGCAAVAANASHCEVRDTNVSVTALGCIGTAVRLNGHSPTAALRLDNVAITMRGGSGDLTAVACSGVFHTVAITGGSIELDGGTALWGVRTDAALVAAALAIDGLGVTAKNPSSDNASEHALLRIEQHEDTNVTVRNCAFTYFGVSTAVRLIDYKIEHEAATTTSMPAAHISDNSFMFGATQAGGFLQALVIRGVLAGGVTIADNSVWMLTDGPAPVTCITLNVSSADIATNTTVMSLARNTLFVSSGFLMKSVHGIVVGMRRAVAAVVLTANTMTLAAQTVAVCVTIAGTDGMSTATKRVVSITGGTASAQAGTAVGVDVSGDSFTDLRVSGLRLTATGGVVACGVNVQAGTNGTDVTILSSQLFITAQTTGKPAYGVFATTAVLGSVWIASTSLQVSAQRPADAAVLWVDRASAVRTITLEDIDTTVTATGAYVARLHGSQLGDVVVDGVRATLNDAQEDLVVPGAALYVSGCYAATAAPGTFDMRNVVVEARVGGLFAAFDTRGIVSFVVHNSSYGDVADASPRSGQYSHFAVSIGGETLATGTIRFSNLTLRVRHTLRSSTAGIAVSEGAWSSGLYIEGNTILLEDPAPPTAAFSYGVIVTDAESSGNVSIEANTIVARRTKNGIFVETSTGFTSLDVLDNNITIDGDADNAIRVQCSTDAVIRNSVATVAGNAIAVTNASIWRPLSLLGSCSKAVSVAVAAGVDVSVTGNSITWETRDAACLVGFYVTGATRTVTLEDNTVSLTTAPSSRGLAAASISPPHRLTRLSIVGNDVVLRGAGTAYLVDASNDNVSVAELAQVCTDVAISNNSYDCASGMCLVALMLSHRYGALCDVTISGNRVHLTSSGSSVLGVLMSEAMSPPGTVATFHNNTFVIRSPPFDSGGVLTFGLAVQGSTRRNITFASNTIDLRAAPNQPSALLLNGLSATEVVLADNTILGPDLPAQGVPARNASGLLLESGFRATHVRIRASNTFTGGFATGTTLIEPALLGTTPPGGIVITLDECTRAFGRRVEPRRIAAAAPAGATVEVVMPKCTATLSHTETASRSVSSSTTASVSASRTPSHSVPLPTRSRAVSASASLAASGTVSATPPPTRTRTRTRVPTRSRSLSRSRPSSASSSLAPTPSSTESASRTLRRPVPLCNFTSIGVSIVGNGSDWSAPVWGPLRLVVPSVELHSRPLRLAILVGDGARHGAAASDAWGSSAASMRNRIASVAPTLHSDGFAAHLAGRVRWRLRAAPATVGGTRALQVTLPVTPDLFLTAEEEVRIVLAASAFACQGPTALDTGFVLATTPSVALAAAATATRTAAATSVAAMVGGSGAAAGDAQALAALAFVQCGSSAVKQTPKHMAFVLGPLNMGGPYGVIAGNVVLVLLVGVCQLAAAGAVRVVGRCRAESGRGGSGVAKDGSAATLDDAFAGLDEGSSGATAASSPKVSPIRAALGLVRFPGVTLAAAALAVQGTALHAFSAVLRGDMHPLALVGSVFAVGVAAATWWLMRRVAAPTFEQRSDALVFFEYVTLRQPGAPGTWRRKLLPWVLPVGRWGPLEAARMWATPVRPLLPQWAVTYCTAPLLQALVLAVLASLPVKNAVASEDDGDANPDAASAGGRKSGNGWCVVQLALMAVVVLVMGITSAVARPTRIRAASVLQLVSSCALAVAFLVSAIAATAEDGAASWLLEGIAFAAYLQTLATVCRVALELTVKVLERVRWDHDGHSHIYVPGAAVDAAVEGDLEMRIKTLGAQLLMPPTATTSDDAKALL